MLFRSMFRARTSAEKKTFLIFIFLSVRNIMILEFLDGQRQREEHKGNRGKGIWRSSKKEEATRAASVPFQGTVRRTSASVREERDPSERFLRQRSSTTVCIPCIPKGSSGASAPPHSGLLLSVPRIWSRYPSSKPFIPYPQDSVKEIPPLQRGRHTSRQGAVDEAIRKHATLWPSVMLRSGGIFARHRSEAQAQRV